MEVGVNAEAEILEMNLTERQVLGKDVQKESGTRTAIFISFSIMIRSFMMTPEEGDS